MSPLFGKKPPPVAPTGGEGGKESGIPALGQVKEIPAPKTSTDAIVQKAPDVIPQLQRVTEQREIDARQTIDMLEKARAEKGNFCVTLGSGDKRIVVLIAPQKRDWVGTAFSYGHEYPHDDTFMDYILITPQGPRRISFYSECRTGEPRWAEEGKLKQQKFQEVLDKVAKGNGVIEGAEYRVWAPDPAKEVSYTLNIPITDSYSGKTTELHEFGDYRPDAYAESYHFGPVTDEMIVERAVRDSLAKVQSPIQGQLNQIRSEIGALSAVHKGLS